MELLCHCELACLALGKIAKWFSKAVEPIYTSTNQLHFPPFQSCYNSCDKIWRFLLVILVGVLWYLTGVLLATSWWLMMESTFSCVCLINTCWKNGWIKTLSTNGNKSDHLGPCLKSTSDSPSLMGAGWNLSPGQHGPAHSGPSWSLLPKMSPFCFSLQIPVFRFLQGLAPSCYMVFHKLFSYPRTQLRPPWNQTHHLFLSSKDSSSRQPSLTSTASRPESFKTLLLPLSS